jgi:hypothetical protein
MFSSQSQAEIVTAKAKTCPTAAFPNLSKSVGAGAGYAKPSLSVSCSSTELKVVSNGMISFPFEPKTPNALAPQQFNWSVPLNPVKAKSVTTIKNVLGGVNASSGGYGSVTVPKAATTPSYYYYPSDPRSFHLSVNYKF